MNKLLILPLIFVLITQIYTLNIINACGAADQKLISDLGWGNDANSFPAKCASNGKKCVGFSGFDAKCFSDKVVDDVKIQPPNEKICEWNGEIHVLTEKVWP